MLYAILAEDLPGALERRLGAQDTYAKAGVYASVTVRPFRKVLPQ